MTYSRHKQEVYVSMVQSNVSKWFIEKETPFFDPLPKVKSKTFPSLYKMTFAGKQNKTTIKADTRLLQQPLTASLTGRKVDLEAGGYDFNTFLVFCRDTDVFLMLIHFFRNKYDIEVWMVSGTAKQRKCYPIHDIAQQLPEIITNNLLGFHSLTRCDTTS